jgi:hypothetical protein
VRAHARVSVTRRRAFGLSFVPVTALADRAFAAVCRAEARVPVPIGTSLIVAARPARRR